MITLYSINFQIGQIGNSNPFSIKRTVVRVKNFEKSINFFSLKSLYSRLANKKKFILPLVELFKHIKDMIIGTECI